MGNVRAKEGREDGKEGDGGGIAGFVNLFYFIKNVFRPIKPERSNINLNEKLFSHYKHL